MDKSIPHYGVVMVLDEINNDVKINLPVGYKFSMYEKGDEKDWAKIETSVGEFGDEQKALERFQREFGKESSLMESRCIFIEDSNGDKIATTTAWYGDLFGKEQGRIHWVAVMPNQQGKGLGKALISKALLLFYEQGFTGNIYLTTQTWSYKAIKMYKKFGFKPYIRGNNSQDDKQFQDDQKAWSIINKIISG